MKTRQLRGVLITPNKEGTQPREATIEYSGFKDLYKLLNCDMIEIPCYKFGNGTYDVYCDEEGLLKNGNKPSILAISGMFGQSVVVGSVFIVGRNNRSLTDKQVAEILGTIQTVQDKFGNKYNVVVSKSV